MMMGNQALAKAADPPPLESPTMEQSLGEQEKKDSRVISPKGAAPTSLQGQDGGTTNSPTCHSKDNRLHSAHQHAIMMKRGLAGVSTSSEDDFLVCLPASDEANRAAAHRQVSEAREVSFTTMESVDTTRVVQKELADEEMNEVPTRVSPENATGVADTVRRQESAGGSDDDDDSSADEFVNSLINDGPTKPEAKRPHTSPPNSQMSSPFRDGGENDDVPMQILTTRQSTSWSESDERMVALPKDIEPSNKPDVPAGWLFTEFSTANIEEGKSNEAPSTDNVEMNPRDADDEQDVSQNEESSDDDGSSVETSHVVDQPETSEAVEASNLDGARERNGRGHPPSESESEDERSDDIPVEDEEPNEKPSSRDGSAGNDSDDDSRPESTLDSSSDDEEEKEEEEDDDIDDDLEEGPHDQSQRQKRPESIDAISISSTESENLENNGQDSKESKKRSRPTESVEMEQAPSSPGRLERDWEPEAGDRVYAKFPKNGQWYWGKIQFIKKKKGSPEFRFSIEYDDGDVSHQVVRDDIRTVNEVRRDWFDGKLLSLEEMHMLRCDKCELCVKPDCGSCASCRRNKRLSAEEKEDAFEVCLQKMCGSIPESQKQQPAKGLPAPWTFVFHLNYPYRGRRSYVPGLFISYPNHDTTYRSVEAVVNSAAPMARLNPNAAQEFNRHIGIEKSHHRTPRSSDAHVRATPIHTVSSRSPLVASKTVGAHGKVDSGKNHRACGSCENCSKDPCGSCDMCTSSPNGSSPKCFQKMCFMLSPEEKAKPAPGFPDGWAFYFAEEPAKGASPYEPIPNLFILSKGGKKFRSVKAAIGTIKGLGNEVDVACEFYPYVGLLDQMPASGERGHAIERPRKKQRTGSVSINLVGKKLRFNWIDKRNRRNVVYGKVTDFDKDDETGDVHSFKVVYRKRSRELANGVVGDDAPSIPESQSLPPPQVLGGCIRFAKQLKTPSSQSFVKDATQMHFWKWITPRFRVEGLLESRGGVRLPRLTLDVHGCTLEFNVKPSTIPGAGYGVFLKCTPSFATDEDSDSDNDFEQVPFELSAGELVDVGIYSPFRIEDRRPEAIFFVKNYVHSHKCEEWTFGTGDSHSQFDITDCITGNIHSEARSHIPAYVNESNDLDAICIRAEHDPEGSVHYLLGHAYASQGTFSMPTDGTEREVFVNYGDDYELVRCRKGYSFLPEGCEEKEDLLDAIAQEDAIDLKEMIRFKDVDVEATVSYFLDFFARDVAPNFASNVLYRMLTVAVVLQCRIRKSRIDRQCRAQDDRVGENEGAVDWIALLRDVDELVTHLLDAIEGDAYMVKLKHLQVTGSHEKLLYRVLRMQLSEVEAKGIEDMLA